MDEAIYFLAEKNNHDNFHCVFAIVKLINSLYSTQIQDVHLKAVSAHIVELEKSCNLSELINNSDPLVVKNIANTKGIIEKSNNEQNKERVSLEKKPLKRSYNCWSFATKYCAFHNPEYMIYDSIIRKELVSLEVVKKESEIYIGGSIDASYKKYLCYCESIKKLRMNIKLPENISNKDFDKFLWIKNKMDF